MGIGLKNYDDASIFIINSSEHKKVSVKNAANKFADIHHLQSTNNLTEVSEYNESNPNFFSEKTTVTTTTQPITFFHVGYKQYIHRLQNRLIKFRKNNLFFPFHNFW